MKKILLLNVLLVFLYGSCGAQNHSIEYWPLIRYTPKLRYVGDGKETIPAGYELPIHSIFHNIYGRNSHRYDTSYHWTFLYSLKEGTIGIQTPFVPYDSTRKTILRITDTTKTVCRIIPYDSIRDRIPEIIYYDEKLKIEPYLRRKRNRENMIITNDSLTIYLINIRPKHLETVRKTVTTPVDMN